MRRCDQGFTLIEMLIATSLTVAVTAATFSLLNPAHGMFAAQLEVMDMQQRLRIGVGMLQKDLLMAGAGMYSGSMTGSLENFFAPILPLRVGNAGPDPAGSYFTDRVSLVYVPSTSAQTSILDPMPGAPAELRVNPQPGCPSGDERCGFRTGMTVMIMDDTGSWDAFSVANAQSAVLSLRHLGDGAGRSYGTDSYISQIAMYTYWLKTDAVAGTYQLMRYDGNSSDVPIADNVVGLSFEYYGEPEPPQLRSRLARATTYGPRPPALGVDNEADSWGAGENCVFTISAGGQVPRLDWLGDNGGGLVKLARGRFTDGPWCPDGASPGKYDADLLRIRKVRVTLRVQAASPAFRGSAGSLFAYGGTARGGERFLPDQEIKFDVTPRNVNLGR